MDELRLGFAGAWRKGHELPRGRQGFGRRRINPPPPSWLYSWRSGVWGPQGSPGVQEGQGGRWVCWGRSLCKAQAQEASMDPCWLLQSHNTVRLMRPFIWNGIGVDVLDRFCGVYLHFRHFFHVVISNCRSSWCCVSWEHPCRNTCPYSCPYP